MRNETVSTVSTKKLEILFLLASCLLVLSGCQSQKPKETTNPSNAGDSSAAPAPAPANTQQSAGSNFEQQHQQAEKQLRPQIESRRQQEQQQAEQTVDPDAITAIQQTEAAIKAIAANNKNEAVSDIEQATGKIDILVARKPASGLIPVHVDVAVIDDAPQDTKAIDALVQAATDAVKQRDLPAARILLASLVSELRIRTTFIPLATYPTALQQAAKLLDQGKNQEAGNVLLTALNTLVIDDRVIPLPLILAQAAVEQADAQRQNKNVALTLLQTAKNQLDRSRRLGYMSDDAEYKTLDNDISSLETAVKGPSNTTALFSHLKDRIEAFIQRQKAHKQRS
jgi:hypothetical protein